MSLTRAQAEGILIRRIGRLVAAASLDGTTVDGTNADLADPLATAVRQLGGTVANRATVTDADLASVAREEALLDMAELRALESALGNLDVVDVQVGPEREALGQLGTRLETAIARKRAQIQREHGIGLASPFTSGSSSTVRTEATW